MSLGNVGLNRLNGFYCKISQNILILMCIVSLQEGYIECSASQTGNGTPVLFLMGSGLV